MTMSRDGILAKNNKFDPRSWVRSPKKILKKSSEISEAEMRIRTSVEKGYITIKQQTLEALIRRYQRRLRWCIEGAEKCSRGEGER